MKLRAFINRLAAFAALIAVYFAVVGLLSGIAYAREQFATFGVYLISLAAGFDVQVGLYTYLRRLVDSAHASVDVVMNTQGAPLQGDLAASAVLVNAQGRTYAPLAWRGDGPGSHHRKGLLAFAPTTPRPEHLELRLQRPGEAAPRSFRWTLPAQ